MEKVIRDGLVAVLYAPGFGAGWFSWHDIEDLVYDPVVVDMVEREKDPDNIVKYCVSKYSDSHYYGGADQLAIQWLPVGTRFVINEYDGSESVLTEEDMNWGVA